MIIIEGADNVGKSTLIDQLIELDPRLYVMKRERFRPSKGGSIGSSYLKMLLPGAGRDLLTFGIADRLLASECIYGELFRGKCRMTPHEHFLIKAVLMSYGALVIHCDAPDRFIIDSWNTRAQLYEQDPLLIARTYRARLERIFRPLEVIKYDWTNSDASMRREAIVRLHARTVTRYLSGLAANASTCTTEDSK